MEEIPNKMPENIPEQFTRQDRDTIIRLDTKFDRLSQDIRELKDSVVDRVSKLEADRATKSDLDAIKSKAEQLALRKVNSEDIVLLNTRVDSLEKWKSWMVGTGTAYILLAGIIASLLTYIYFNNLNHIQIDLEKHMVDTKGGETK